MKDLISIIIPVYNAEEYIEKTVETIQSQSYNNWEALFIDDCSIDDSVKLLKKYIKKDSRIKLLCNDTNSGAAISRNNGIKNASGDFLCFLDADDLWAPKKLEKQLDFMLSNDCEFSYTSYEFADASGKPNGTIVNVPNSITYRQALKNTTIWTSTVMLNMKKLSKNDIYMPNVRRGQDTATWWKILKKIKCAYGLNEVLSFYRRTNNSLSANKIKALKRTWNLYRNVEHLNIVSSCYNFSWYCFNAVKRRI